MDLDHLTVAELIILEEHIKIGEKHLKKHVTEEEFHELLALPDISEKSAGRIKSTDTEIAANLSLVLNTIFTATFGAWMGYSGFLGLDLFSGWTFGFIVFIAACLGGFIGYQNVQATKGQARNSIHLQKFQMLQLKILEKIKQKKTQEKDQLIQNINHQFRSLSEGSFAGSKSNTLDLFAEWDAKLKEIIHDKMSLFEHVAAKNLFMNELSTIQLDLKRVMSNYPQDENIEVIHENAKNRHLASYLQKLINVSPKRSVSPPDWLESSKQSILIGLAPTLLGGFSSLNVYLGGVPLILKNYGREDLAALLANPKVKAIELTISLLITFYFGFSFLYANRKNFKRQRELAKSAQLIIQTESTLTLLDAWTIKLKELKSSLDRLVRMYTLIKSL
jgi:hypothetical protein